MVISPMVIEANHIKRVFLVVDHLVFIFSWIFMVHMCLLPTTTAAATFPDHATSKFIKERKTFFNLKGQGPLKLKKTKQHNGKS
jgi:hypothetical protein